VADAGGEPAGALRVRNVDAARRHVLLRRDRPGPRRGDESLPQRDVRDAAARNVTDEPATQSESSPEPLRKESARMARRVSQLESTLEQVEQIRDTNAR